MSPDQLRALADALRPMAAAPCFDGIDLDRAADFLLACAEEKPVAWMHDGLVSTNKERVEHDEMRNRSCGFKPKPIIPLYAAPAAPQAKPKRPEIEVSLAAGHGYWGVAICIGVQRFPFAASFWRFTEADEYAERLRTALGITGDSDADR